MSAYVMILWLSTVVAVLVWKCMMFLKLETMMHIW